MVGFPGLGVKTGSYRLVICASKSPRQFDNLGLKISTTVSWFGPQNQMSYGLSVVLQNGWEDEVGLLYLEASQDRVFQFNLKTSGDTVWMVHVTSSLRLRRVEAEDGPVDATECVRPFYSNFIVFYVLDHMDILVIYSFTWTYK
jgi:hypothetical protein